MGIAAHEVEPLIMGVIAGRLAKPDAVDLLRAELHDEAEAEALRVEANTQNAEPEPPTADAITAIEAIGGHLIDESANEGEPDE